MEINNIKYAIRTVRTTDLEQLFNMLIDLVKYEGSFKNFKLTKERLENELFGINADWHCLVAADPYEQVLGFCFFTFANINGAFNLSPMIQVDHLYVSPEFRNAKIGFNLLYQLTLIAKSRNIGRLNVWCMKDNLPAHDFYQKVGAEKRDFIDVYSIQATNLSESADRP